MERRLTRALATAAFIWACGCATHEPPPESSLPGTMAVRVRGVDEVVFDDGVDAGIPAAEQPVEGQLAPRNPDPASGAGTLVTLTAIMGGDPFSASRPRGAGSEPGRWTADGEASRGRSLQSQIEEELRRQREALDGLEANPTGRSTVEALITGESLAERANPRIAPKVPEEREVPDGLFERETVTILAGSWGNDAPIRVVRARLDADEDGKPEQIRFIDSKTKELLRLERDANFDGALDSWSTYEHGQLVARVLDTNDDGAPDVWERYAKGRMTERTIDRNRDNTADAFYLYSGGVLVEERHDTNDDGAVDRRIRYKNLFRTHAEEDLDNDGAMDTWTHYGVFQGKEMVTRIERASHGGGAPNIVETYDTSSGRSVLSKREEDKNGDGSIDITSYYKNGKLVQREISDPALAPL